jgi:hypothetical protein
VVHAEIQPRHVLIQSTENVAKLSAPIHLPNFERSLTSRAAAGGEALRALAYLAPERVRGNAPGDSRSDLYSLGATVYTLLAGRPPFTGKTATDLAAQILQTEVVRPKEFQLSLPDRFEQVVLRLLAKRPEDRYPSPAALLADLDRVLKSPTEPEARPAPAPPAPQPVTSPAPAPAAPSAPRAEDKISVTCVCGQLLQARTKYAGTRVRCPICASELILPGRTLAGSPATAAGTAPRLSRQPAAPAPELMELPRESRGSGLLKAIAYGVVAMIVVAALLFFGGTLLWDRFGPSNSITPPSTPKAKNTPSGRARAEGPRGVR